MSSYLRNTINVTKISSGHISTDLYLMLSTGNLPNHSHVLGYLLYHQEYSSREKLGVYNVANDLVLYWARACYNVFTINIYHS